MRDIFQGTFSVVKETSKLSLERLDSKKKVHAKFWEIPFRYVWFAFSITSYKDFSY